MNYKHAHRKELPGTFIGEANSPGPLGEERCTCPVHKVSIC